MASMKPRPLIPQRKQQGIQLLWLTLILIGIVYTASLPAARSLFRDARNQYPLKQAKEALIARAVADDNRPGSLPCPDLITDSNGLNNHPGDGKADLFTLTQCPSYLGWLPWITLDLPELLDTSGNRLWYALDSRLRDDDSSQPINSRTGSNLWLDNLNDVAAIVVAPGAPLAAQMRPSTSPAAYLERENGTGDHRHFISGPADAAFNDRVLAITRGELMSAVEKRVAGEVLQCLHAHAQATNNLDHRYPWPSPLGVAGRQGNYTSRFGRIPLTQPDRGLQFRGSEFAAQLSNSLNRLEGAGIAEQEKYLQQLAADLTAVGNLADIAYLSNSELWAQAEASRAPLNALLSATSSAVTDNRISRTEGNLIRTRGDSALTPLAYLPEVLQKSGSDVLPGEIRRQVALIAANGNIQTILLESAQLLNATASPRADFSNAIASARIARDELESIYLATPASSDKSALLGDALARLRQSLSDLDNIVAASRVNRRASDIADLRELLGQLLLQPDSPTRQAAIGRLIEQLAALETGEKSLLRLRDTATRALLNSQASPDSLQVAGDALEQLANAMSSLEANDRNLTHSSLLNAIARFTSAKDSFSAVDTATPRPVQRDIVPYAEAFDDSADSPAYLARLVADYAAGAAILAKNTPFGAGTDPAKIAAQENSLSQKNQLAISSTENALAQLQAYRSTPTSYRQAKASQAVAEASLRAKEALTALSTLNAALSTDLASAQPMLWLSGRCNFLRPGSNSWWYANAWDELTFFQISGPLTDSPANLQVNAQDKLQIVVIVAGAALPGQSGSTNVHDLFEDANADESRNGNASNPVARFVSRAPSRSFNDRLAW